jgi:hypothetical protein
MEAKLGSRTGSEQTRRGTSTAATVDPIQTYRDEQHRRQRTVGPSNVAWASSPSKIANALDAGAHFTDPH